MKTAEIRSKIGWNGVNHTVDTTITWVDSDRATCDVLANKTGQVRSVAEAKTMVDRWSLGISWPGKVDEMIVVSAYDVPTFFIVHQSVNHKFVFEAAGVDPVMMDLYVSGILHPPIETLMKIEDKLEQMGFRMYTIIRIVS